MSPEEVGDRMRRYEVMVILDPDLEERTVAPSLETFLNVVKQDGGSVEKVEIHDAGLLLPYVREGVGNSVKRMRFEPVVIDGQVFQVGASVGARSFSGRAHGADVLLNDADAACYAAKRAGRGRVEMAGAPGAGFSPCASRTSP